MLSISMMVCLSPDALGQNERPFQDSIIGTLSNPKLARDLELVGDQKKMIEDLLHSFGDMQARFARDLKESLARVSVDEQKVIRVEFKKRSDVERQRIVARIKESLLPHQIERLEQLTVQRLMNESERKKKSTGLLSKTMIDYLEIRPQQEERIREKSDEIRRRAAKQIQQILTESQEEILEELTPEQKDKYQKLVGDPLPLNEFDNKPKKSQSKKTKPEKTRQ